MEPNPPGRRDPAPFGPPTAGAGLPVLPGLSARLAAAAGRGDPEPVGGGPEILEAACGYWSRRGLRTDPYHVLATGGAEGLLLALFAAVGGDVLAARPCAPWHTAQAAVLGHPAYPVATPAECGGVPDAFALLETVRRVREEGGDPRLLVLSVADDPTGTVAPPDLLHETCEAAAEQGLLIVSDETYRDTLHPPGGPGTARAGTGPDGATDVTSPPGEPPSTGATRYEGAARDAGPDRRAGDPGR
ncbi:aminotransferase class I/II-fold pyridoxal phosphate-dependent enzyme, partial [Streptomyces lycii]